MRLIDGIAVWGEPEENALAQMKNAIRHERVVAGALMGDNHLGYAVPVGGVIAYDGGISPSGVGVDISCFVGTQQVRLLDGRDVSLCELVQEHERGVQNFVYSVAPSGQIVVDRIESPRQTGWTKEVVRITLDTGAQIESTPDHHFYTRGGDTRQAADLKPGDSLMPLYLERWKDVPYARRAFKDKKLKLGPYLAVYNPGSDLYSLVHHLADNYNLIMGTDSEAKGRVRHHKDFEKDNNNPTNIVRMDGLAHFALHAAHGSAYAKAGKSGFKLQRARNPEFYAALGSRNMKLLHQRPDFRERLVRRASRHIRICLASEGFRNTIKTAGLRGREALIKWNQSEAGRAAGSINTLKTRTCGACGNSFPNQSEYLKHWHAAHRTDEQRAHQIASLKGRNHTVVAIERIHLDQPEPVYCLTAPQFHNFALSAGVFVHNCGNKAIRTDMPGAELRRRIGPIMDEVWKTISFGMGRNNNEPVKHSLFDKDHPGWSTEPAKSLKRMAENQLGTVGGGNHYVDLFVDEKDRVWIGCHFGSRGLGHKIAQFFFKAGGAKDGMMVDPLVFATDSDLGQQYIAAMHLAGEYAYAGRDWVCDRVARILGANVLDEVHNNHNFCIPGDQIVPTTNGPRLMRDIKPGDYIYTPTDMGIVATRVVRQWQSGWKPVITVRTRSRELRVSPEHPVLALRLITGPHPQRKLWTKSIGRPVWTLARYLRKGDIIVCADGYYPEQTRDECSLHMARLAGAFLGDGWIRHKNPDISGYSVGLAIGDGQQKHTARYRELLESLLPDANWRVDAPGAYGISTSSVEVWHTITNLGIGADSLGKSVPEWIFSLPVLAKLEFLSGYMDADGSVAGPETNNSGRGTIASTNEHLVRQIREIALACELQITPVNNEWRESNFGRALVFRCTMSADSVNKLNLWHEDKSARKRKTRFSRPQGLSAEKIGYCPLQPSTFAQRVVDISYSEIDEPVYDLEVEHENHAFICEGVVVHNCWEEEWQGRKVWVVRKGATPAYPGERGFVGGSMGDISVILQGIENEQAAYSFYSTVHGAGRAMGRKQATGVKPKPGRMQKQSNGAEVWVDPNPGRPALVTKEMMQDWVRQAGVELRGADVDESPHCYKRLPEVLAAHVGTIEVLHVLQPVGVAMADPETRDPYKD